MIPLHGDSMYLGRLAETDYETLQCEISTHLLNCPGKCFASYDKSTTPKYPMPAWHDDTPAKPKRARTMTGEEMRSCRRKSPGGGGFSSLKDGEYKWLVPCRSSRLTNSSLQICPIRPSTC